MLRCGNPSRQWLHTDEKKPTQVVRGLESTEVVEETDLTIHALLRRTKSNVSMYDDAHNIVVRRQQTDTPGWSAE
ncbi:hypothetical protein CBM2599_A10003 [Cupriavidus taiwanensis]|nr:hypothetical protein CBM2599_A10003 [Cupriavidus taiwanensis]SOY87678.1 hypothetical protein CBM2600_A170003 [Cupriavidus taiwanensis]